LAAALEQVPADGDGAGLVLRRVASRNAWSDASEDDEGSAGESAFALRLASLPEGDRLRVLTDLVCSQVADVLGLGDVAELDAGKPFRDLGFDSMAAVELRGRLGTTLGVRLPATLVFSHPTPADLAGHLLGEIGGGAQGPADAVVGEFGRLEKALGALTADDETRAAVTQRLEALLWKWREPVGSADEPVPAGAALEAVSAQEIFDLLDRELGTA
jgi:acyl carrier protein